MHSIGIRKEDKNRWERRVAVVPSDMDSLISNEKLDFIVQSSPIRTFADPEFEKAGAGIAQELENCQVILAVKEIPVNLLQKNTTYLFFSHTVKGQAYNMEMLKKLMALRCNLIDYERIVDSDGKRIVFFGRHAGLAGMVDTLWALGQRLVYEGHADTPFREIKHAWEYKNLQECKDQLKVIGSKIESGGIPGWQGPIIMGFTGYGNVSQGAQEILDCFPVKSIAPEELEELCAGFDYDPRKIYKVVFHEKHMVKPINKDLSFDLNKYFTCPQKYFGIFEKYLLYLNVLVNCIYWDKQYPKLVTKDFLKSSYDSDFAPGSLSNLKVIGDITCDIEGSIECNTKAAKPDNPVYVYEPRTGKTIDGVIGNGPVIMAVDNLPCEFPRESSQAFSQSLYPFLPALAKADYNTGFNDLNLPPALKKAMILYKGEFTPDYRFMEDFLK